MKTYFTLLVLILPGFSKLHGQKLDWAHQLGSSSTDFGYAIATDNFGNLVSTGFFQGTADFDPGSGTHSITANGQQAYVWKLDSSGALSWVRVLGAQEGRAIATDHEGSVYISGEFQGAIDIDPGPGLSNLVSSGPGSDLYFLKLDSAGNFQWATAITGGWSEKCTSIAPDSLGNLYITGRFNDSASFNLGSTQRMLYAPGVTNAFIARIDSTGQLEWVQHFGSGSNVIGKAMGLGKDGHIYAAGYFEDSANFLPPTSTSLLSASGSYDAFLCKLSPAGNLIWQKSFGGNGREELHALCISDSGYIYAGGGFSNTTDMAIGSPVINLTAAGSLDIFVTKIDTAGNTIWARNMGGSSAACVAYALSTDAFGNLYSTGSYHAGPIDADPGPGTHNLSWSGHGDIFISKLDAAGNFDWAAGLGNSFLDIGFGIATDSLGNCYSTGHFSGQVDFDPDTNTYNLTSADLWDSYVVKYSPCFINTQHNISACDSFYLPNTNRSFRQSGQYIQYTSVPGACDSLIQYNFSVLPSDSSFLSRTTCDSLNSPSGHYTWYSSGLYTDTLAQQNGCDSILWIDLTLADTSSSYFQITACDSYLSPGGKLWTASGLYVDTIPNHQACDSIMSIQLSISESTTASITDTACNLYTSPSGRHIWTSSGSYIDTLVNQAGCDSLLNINLHIQSPINQISPRACFRYTSPTGAKTWTSSGTYFDTIQRPGCDSILQLNLVIDTVDTRVQNNSPTLIAAPNADSYQWIYCDSLALAGDTNQSFTASANGRYAVVVVQNGCTDTSGCFTISNVNLPENPGFNHLSVYPSPTPGHLNLDLGASFANIRVSLFDVQGRLVSAQSFQYARLLNFEITGAEGIYFLKVENEESAVWKKVIKVKNETGKH